MLLLGGGRALLLEVAHPLVAAGVAAHSNFRTQPLQRLSRTLELMLTLTFADAAHAIAAVRQIERVHAQVHGRLETTIGPFPRGTPYDGNDPELLFWVHATLVDTALLVYERFVARLTRRESAQYYQESKIAARLFGIPEPVIPRDLTAFRAYMRRMVHSDTLAVGPASREIAASILQPRVALPLRPAFRLVNFFTVALLPPLLRERYELPWGWTGDAALQAAAKVAQRTLPLLPDLMRALPYARRRMKAGSRVAPSG